MELISEVATLLEWMSIPMRNNAFWAVLLGSVAASFHLSI